MSENVKIKINEYDNTKPAGRGTDSTDIVFIPGLSIVADAPVDEPTLVTSVKEFEDIFGTEPYRFLPGDVVKPDYVTNVTFDQYDIGDFDKSYIYAKELLHQGMPVLYMNITNQSWQPTEYSSEGIDQFVTCNKSFYVGHGTTPSTESEYITIDLSNETTYPLKVEVTFNAGRHLDVTSSDDYYRHAVVPGMKLKVTGINTQDLETIRKHVHVSDEVTLIKPEGNDFDTELIDNYNTHLLTLKSYNREGKYPDIYHQTLGHKFTITVDNPSVKYIILHSEWIHRSNNIYRIYNRIQLPDFYDTLIKDKSIYSVKYITSGGFPSIGIEPITDSKGAIVGWDAKNYIASNMLACAKNRGDAVALIDVSLDAEKVVFGTDAESNSVYKLMSDCFSGLTNLEYGAAMYPWGTYNCGSTMNFKGAGSPYVDMPPSFGYLMCVAKAIKTSPNWLAMAGVSRGVVPGLDKLLVPGGVISNYSAEEMQPKYGNETQKYSINTITNVRPYGLTLWGNRTLKPVDPNGTVALNFLNIRNMLSDIKKLLYTTAKACMFEQNSDDLWLRFKDGIRPLLDRLKAGNGISDYKIIKGKTRYNGDPLTKGELAAVIKIYPMYAVEYFELAVEINDEEVTVE